MLATQETWVQSLGLENAMEKGTAIHSITLAWRFPCTEEPSGLQSMGFQRVGHKWVTNTSTLTIFHTFIQFTHPVASNSLQPHGLQHARPPCLSPTPQSLLKLMSTESVMPSNHFILCRPLLLLPSVFPSIRVFSSESVLWVRWPKYWSFSFSINPSNEYSGLISFRMD